MALTEVEQRALAERQPCPVCGGHEDHLEDPRHVVGDVVPVQAQATLPDGSTRTVTVQQSAYYHFDCHASLGCDHCAEMLHANGGAVKGKARKLSVPRHLHRTDITPHFDHIVGPQHLSRRTAGHDVLPSAMRTALYSGQEG